MKKNILIIVLCSMLFLLTGCDDLKFDTNRDRVIESPDKSYSLTLRYDYVSRPFIFKDGELIYEYEGNGFAESVGFEIEWIDDNKILLYLASPQKEKYSKERYIINIKK